MDKGNEPCRYIRVEGMDLSTDETFGGFMSAATLLLTSKLDLPPECSMEEISEKVNASTDPEVYHMLAAIMCLADIPQPEIYINDRKNHYCLYSPEEYEEIREDLYWISDHLRDLCDDFVLVSKEFFLRDDEILYDDGYQIVISKETYDRHKAENKYEALEYSLLEEGD